MTEAPTLPSRAQVKSHGALLRDLKRADEFATRNIQDFEEYQQLKDQLTSSSSNVKVSKPNVPLEGCVGLKEIKRDIFSYLAKSGDSEESFEDDGNFDRILLFGETGTGKAHFTRAIATTINASLIEINNSHFLLSKWASNMELVTQIVFDICKKVGPSSVMFLKHLDAFCANEEETRTMINFVHDLQRTWEKIAEESSPLQNSRLIIFASTNKPNKLDEKLVLSFERRMYMPTLNMLERKQLFQNMIQKSWKFGHVMTSKQMDLVAGKTYGILTSEIEVLVDKAIRVQYPKWPTRMSTENFIEAVEWRALEFMDFAKVLQGYLVLDSKSFSEFETFHRRFGNGHFQSVYQREKYDVDAPCKNGKKKHGWVFKLVSLF